MTSSTTVASTTQSYSVTAVQDVSIIPYCRSIPIQFYAQKMRPGTKVYAFFDGVAVSQYCTPLQPQWTTASQVAQGVQLVTDSNGECQGTFVIPENTFFTGTRVFKLSDDPSGKSDPDTETTASTCSFFSGGLNITSQTSTLNIITPTTTPEQQTGATPVTTPSSGNVSTSDPAPPTTPAPPPPPSSSCSDVTATNTNNYVYQTCLCASSTTYMWCAEPVAQAFVTTSEMFLTAVGLYFEQIDPLAPDLYVEIRNMDNGYPGSTILAKKDFNITQLNAWAISLNGPGALPYSADSTADVKIPFDVPVYLESNTPYCFVVGGVSPNTRIWEAYLGQPVVNNPSQTVQTTPTGQPSFRSLNGSTWTAQQYETIKYDLYQAQFQTGALTLALKPAEQDDFHNSFDQTKLQNNPLQTQSGSNRIRVFVKDHGFTEGDSVTLSMYERIPLIYTATTPNPPQITQLLVSGSSSATVYGSEPTGVANQYKLTVGKMTGDFSMGGTTVTALPVVAAARTGVTLRDPTVAQQNGSVVTTTWTINSASGTLARAGTSSVTGNVGSALPTDNFGGIPLSQFNTSHSIVTVDSIDSFIIQVTNNSNFTGEVGGSNVQVLNLNEKYDLFNVSGSYIPYNSTEAWTLTGMGYGRAGTPLRAYDNTILSPVPFVPSHDTYLGQPQKFVSGNTNSLTVKCQFNNNSVNTSPVVNTDTFSVTTVSNRVEKISSANMALAPVDASNPYFISETDPVAVSGGSEQYKYVTQNIVLANPANDLMIYFDVYRDLSADFDVYVKILTVNDSRTMDQIPWQIVDGISKNSYSTDLTDFIEYTIQCSEQVSTWVAGQQFGSFKIKLVGRSTNSCLCPLFQSLRGIAVT